MILFVEGDVGKLDFQNVILKFIQKRQLEMLKTVLFIKQFVLVPVWGPTEKQKLGLD